jgi:hypothetical protein
LHSDTSVFGRMVRSRVLGSIPGIG